MGCRAIVFVVSGYDQLKITDRTGKDQKNIRLFQDYSLFFLFTYSVKSGGRSNLTSSLKKQKMRERGRMKKERKRIFMLMGEY